MNVIETRNILYEHTCSSPRAQRFQPSLKNSNFILPLVNFQPKHSAKTHFSFLIYRKYQTPVYAHALQKIGLYKWISRSESVWLLDTIKNTSSHAFWILTNKKSFSTTLIPIDILAEKKELSTVKWLSWSTCVGCCVFIVHRIIIWMLVPFLVLRWNRKWYNLMIQLLMI